MRSEKSDFTAIVLTTSLRLGSSRSSSARCGLRITLLSSTLHHWFKTLHPLCHVYMCVSTVEGCHQALLDAKRQDKPLLLLIGDPGRPQKQARVPVLLLLQGHLTSLVVMPSPVPYPWFLSSLAPPRNGVEWTSTS